jgi:hypothetical protein
MYRVMDPMFAMDESFSLTAEAAWMTLNGVADTTPVSDQRSVANVAAAIPDVGRCLTLKRRRI